MPSCDGSNCGACSACNCSTSNKTSYSHKKEIERLEKTIAELKAELQREKKLSGKLMDQICNERQAHKKEKEMICKASSIRSKEFPVIVNHLLSSFPGSSILYDREPIEFLCHKKSNTYFILGDCKTKLDVDCKVLEYVSRAAYKSMPYSTDSNNKKFHKQMLDGINTYFDTNFSEQDIETIYTYLGNACNHQKTIDFIESGFDMSLLNPKQEKDLER